ncbi:anti-repressor SinI family protein [Neobacillus sp. FSL H8-0543]
MISVKMIDGMDLEWVALISEAKELGLSKELVREFLHRNEVKESFVENR